jgi:class 3 adenylate cyclase
MSGAERRQITIMQCRLEEAELISARRDPEDVQSLLAEFHKTCSTIVTQAGGTVAKLLTDGALFYFGYPQADEHQAERAVRAALRLVGAASADVVGSPDPLRVHVGIATSIVVVGSSLLGASGGLTALGEAAEMAARLCGLPDSGGILISDATRRLLGDLFQWRARQSDEVGNITGQSVFWEALGEGAVESRFEALHSGATPLVGRDEEMELLRRRWALAKTGNGRVVLISAEPGVGKSRLAAALAEQVATELHFRLRYFCSPYHQDSALYPLIAQMERAANFQHGDEAAEKLTKLQTLLAATAPPMEEMALIAELHAMSSAVAALPLDVPPEHRKEKTFEALLHQVEGLARQQPVLVMFDDVHWVDPSSLELLDRLIERVAEWPVLLLVLFRPEFQPPWTGQPHVTLLTLARLDRRSTVAMIANVASFSALPQEIVDDIVERTDGVPLFVEELTKAVLESGAQGAPAHSVMRRPGPSVPATLHASLMARLDRLGPIAKDVAQAGAVIGREFRFEVLTSIIDLPEPQLRDGLDRLTAAGLLFVRGTPPQSTYIFKHALVQDTAYSTLLRSRRKSLHSRITTTLEDRFPEIVLAQPGLLAQHCAVAGLMEQAIGYWLKAGHLALARSAMTEAAAQFGRALEMLGAMPEGEARDRNELDVAVAAAVPLIAIHGFGSAQVETHAMRAKDLSNRVPHSPHRFAAHRAAWNSSLMRQPVPTTVNLAQELMDLARTAGDPRQLAIAHRALGYSLFMAGKLDAAADVFTRGAELADNVPDSDFAIYGEHPSMVCRVNGGRVRGLMGFPETAAHLGEAGIAHACSRKNPHSLAWALCVASFMYADQGESTPALRLSVEAFEVARQHRLPQWLADAEIIRGWATCRSGDIANGLSLLEKGVRDWQATGAVLHATRRQSMLAESYLLAGNTSAARLHLAAAHAHCESYSETYVAAEICRLEASLSQTEGASGEVVAGHLNEALRIAREQGARLFELRSATILARLHGERGRRAEARDLLAPLYGWFTQGFDIADLQEAKSLLNALA